MRETTSKKNKHMTLEDRIEIQECLSKGMTFKSIAKRIMKDPTTVSKEVKLRGNTYSNGFTKTDEICPRLMKAPFVCNGCSKCHNAGCIYPRRKYSARQAQSEYERVLSEAREGIPLNKESFYKTEAIITSAVKNGQHIYHAIVANNLPVSTATVYRHIAKGYYRISKIDLPRAVKFKPRRSAHPEYVPMGSKAGRSYSDFLEYMSQSKTSRYAEMDTVIGTPGGKVIMTFIFAELDFMFGLLLDNKTAAEAAYRITELKKRLAVAGFLFGDIFPVLLTDNGGEFSNVAAFENDLSGSLESHIFFCNPNAPYQKPHVENNHILFRDIAPSGTSFNDFTQEDVNMIFSHVNAVNRKQFNGKSAYDMFTFAYSDALANALGISFVPADKVIQSPLLLKK